jgi:hypothetical protein
MNDLFFFLVNFLAIAVELFVASSWARGSKPENNVGRTTRRQRFAGFIWLLFFFFWSVPKWQYSKLKVMIERFESSRYFDV